MLSRIKNLFRSKRIDDLSARLALIEGRITTTARDIRVNADTRQGLTSVRISALERLIAQTQSDILILERNSLEGHINNLDREISKAKADLAELTERRDAHDKRRGSLTIEIIRSHGELVKQG